MLSAIVYSSDKRLAILWTALLVLVALLIASRVWSKDRRSLFAVLDGQDGRLSTSKFIAAMWTVVVAYILLALITVWPPDWIKALQNFFPNYALLVGGPVAALVLAKAAVAARVAGGTLNKPPADDGPRLSDLFTDDQGQPDLFDVQYVIFNVIAIAFVLRAFSRATLDGFPSIPDGLLLLTSGPAAVYLSPKFMASDAPVILRVFPTTVAVGETFTISGQNLTPAGGSATGVEVTSGSKTATVIAATATAVQAVAPDPGADLGKAVGVAVKSSLGEAYLDEAITVITPVPELRGADRGSAAVGEPVTLYGGWSTAGDRELTVTLDSSVVGRVVSKTPQTVMFLVPALANLVAARVAQVQVRLAGQTSNAIPLEVTPAAGGASATEHTAVGSTAGGNGETRLGPAVRLPG